MLIEGKNPDGATVSVQLDAEGNIMTTNSNSKFGHVVRDGNIFSVCNQTARTTSVALTTTYTGLVVSNPVTSNKNLIMIRATFALSVAPAAIATLGLITGYGPTGILTHTTPITPQNCYLGQGSAAKALADEAATLVGTPLWYSMPMSGFTAGALPSTSPAVIDIDGLIVVPPGGYCAVGSLTAVTGFFSLVWEEVVIGD